MRPPMEATAAILHRLRPGWTTEARGTLRLAVPMITGQLAQMAMQFCDALMVGYYLGVVPLAASALAISIQSPAFVASIGLMSAVACVPPRRLARVDATPRGRSCATA